MKEQEVLTSLFTAGTLTTTTSPTRPCKPSQHTRATLPQYKCVFARLLLFNLTPLLTSILLLPGRRMAQLRRDALRVRRR